MAISLTMSNFSKFEAMRKNKYAVQFDAIPGSTSAEGLTVACHTATSPQMTISETEIHRINDRSYLPTKAEFQSIEIGFYEYIKDDAAATNPSAGSVLWQWQKKVYDPTTGVMNSKKDISANMLIIQFDGAGTVVRTWNLYGAWPTTVKFDDFDASSADVQSVTATFRYDWAEQRNFPESSTETPSTTVNTENQSGSTVGGPNRNA